MNKHILPFLMIVIGGVGFSSVFATVSAPHESDHFTDTIQPTKNGHTPHEALGFGDSVKVHTVPDFTPSVALLVFIVGTTAVVCISSRYHYKFY